MAFTLLYEPSDAYTTTFVESILAQNGIEYRTIERGLAAAALGLPSNAGFASGPVEIHVPEDRLEAAKKLLCEHDIVCDISERMHRRGFEAFALPLLRGQEQDLGRLTNYLRINNKTTVAAILEDIWRDGPGPQLLVRLFFHLLGGEEETTLRRLAHFLNGHLPVELGPAVEKFLPELGPERRRRLAEMLGLLPAMDPLALLVGLLRDETEEVREAAIESLFMLTSRDFGFEPDAPKEERMRAVGRWEAALERRGFWV